MRLLYDNSVKSVVNDPARCKVSHRHMEVMCHIHTSCNQVWDVDTLAALSRNYRQEVTLQLEQCLCLVSELIH